MAKIGTINGAIVANLQDFKGVVIGCTIDTPNAIAYAMAVNKKAVKAVAHYQYFGESITERAAVSDRFAWVVKEKEVYDKYLNWF